MAVSLARATRCGGLAVLLAGFLLLVSLGTGQAQETQNFTPIELAQFDFRIITPPGGGPIFRPPGRDISPPANNQTRCDPPLVYSQRLNRCVDPPSHNQPQPVSCDFPMVRKGNQCVCPTGFRASRGGCVPLQQEVSCDFPMVRSGNRCVCPGGLELIRGVCVPIRVQIDCAFPLVRSGDRCVCADGFDFVRGRCVPARQQAACEFPFVPRGNGCACAPGFTFRNGRCVDVVVVPPPPPPGLPPPPPEDDVEIARIQRCLNQIGYDAGPVDGLSGPRTVGAFIDFQDDVGLGSRPDRLSDGPTAAALFDVCDRPPPVDRPQQADVTPQPPPPPPEPAAANADASCVPQDLYDLLRTTYRDSRPSLRPCPSACLPKPAFFTAARLDEAARDYGVDWCDSCIQLGAYLPLKAVLEIERAANVTLCAAPPQACFLPRPVTQTRTEVRTIFKALPVSVGNEGDIAVVIGNEAYAGDLPANQNGQNDAEAVHTLLTEQLGYRDENIIDLRNATLADLQRVFGTPDAPGGELAQRMNTDRPGDVFIYVSSHGIIAPEGDETKAYLLPVDGKVDDLGRSALAMDDLYASLGKVGARTIMLVLEASFSRNVYDLVDPPNLPSAEFDLEPKEPVTGLAIFKASDRDQATLEDPEFGIGLFTRYLIEGLAGAADAEPIGNGDKTLDTVEVYAYTADMVRMAARKSFGLEQKPLLSKVDNLAVGRLAQR